MKKALHECSYAGCTALTRDRYCSKHATMKEQRLSPSKRGYNARWQRARLAFLAEHPVCECEDCKVLDIPRIANVVDHIIPHRGNMKLFWDTSNWQAMNKKCHDRKTAKENGGFGNTPQGKKV